MTKDKQREEKDQEAIDAAMSARQKVRIVEAKRDVTFKVTDEPVTVKRGTIYGAFQKNQVVALSPAQMQFMVGNGFAEPVK